MFDYFLKFESETDAKAWIELHQDPKNVAIDDIGTLYNSVDTGTFDEDGHAIFMQEPKQGYHVNVRSRFEMTIDEAILPQTPDRVFAGGV